MMWDSNGWWCGGGWGAGTWLTLIGLVLLTAAATVLVVSLVRGPSRAGSAEAGPAHGPSVTTGPMQGPAGPPRETAREIVTRRYAAGEIDRDEYLQKLQDL